MSDNAILEAVEALTQPVKQARLQEDAHDHDWLKVFVPRPAPERRAFRRAAHAVIDDAAIAKRKLSSAEHAEIDRLLEEARTKIVPTGEWWCPWCDEVTLLPTHDLPAMELRKRVDRALLDELEALTGNGLERTGGSRAAHEWILVDAGAMDLVIKIRDTIKDWIRELGGRIEGEGSLAGLLDSWYSILQASSESGRNRVGTLRAWADKIRKIQNPSQTTEITEICPKCEFAYALTGPEGEEVRGWTLQGVNGKGYKDTSVKCTICGATWSDLDGLRELANATRRLEGKPLRASRPFDT